MPCTVQCKLLSCYAPPPNTTKADLLFTQNPLQCKTLSRATVPPVVPLQFSLAESVLPPTASKTHGPLVGMTERKHEQEGPTPVIGIIPNDTPAQMSSAPSSPLYSMPDFKGHRITVPI